MHLIPCGFTPWFAENGFNIESGAVYVFRSVLLAGGNDVPASTHVGTIYNPLSTSVRPGSTLVHSGFGSALAPIREDLFLSPVAAVVRNAEEIPIDTLHMDFMGVWCHPQRYVANLNEDKAPQPRPFALHLTEFPTNVEPSQFPLVSPTMPGWHGFVSAVVRESSSTHIHVFGIQSEKNFTTHFDPRSDPQAYIPGGPESPPGGSFVLGSSARSSTSLLKHAALTLPDALTYSSSTWMLRPPMVKVHLTQRIVVASGQQLLTLDALDELGNSAGVGEALGSMWYSVGLVNAGSLINDLALWGQWLFVGRSNGWHLLEYNEEAFAADPHRYLDSTTTSAWEGLWASSTIAEGFQGIAGEVYVSQHGLGAVPGVSSNFQGTLEDVESPLVLAESPALRALLVLHNDPLSTECENTNCKVVVVEYLEGFALNDAPQNAADVIEVTGGVWVVYEVDLNLDGQVYHVGKDYILASSSTDVHLVQVLCTAWGHVCRGVKTTLASSSVSILEAHSDVRGRGERLTISVPDSLQTYQQLTRWHLGSIRSETPLVSPPQWRRVQTASPVQMLAYQNVNGIAPIIAVGSEFQILAAFPTSRNTESSITMLLGSHRSIYANSETGDDMLGTGSHMLPVKSLQKAMELACRDGGDACSAVILAPTKPDYDYYMEDPDHAHSSTIEQLTVLKGAGAHEPFYWKNSGFAGEDSKRPATWPANKPVVHFHRTPLRSSTTYNAQQLYMGAEEYTIEHNFRMGSAMWENIHVESWVTPALPGSTVSRCATGVAPTVTNVGSALLVTGVVSLRGSVVSSGCSRNGGAFRMESGALLETIGAELRDNVAFSNGGAVFLSFATLLSLDSVFTRNSVTNTQGGAVAVNGGTFIITGTTSLGCRFTDNSAKTGGGGIAADQQSIGSVNYCSFTANAAFSGGAIALRSIEDVVVDNALMEDNLVNYGGGALATTDNSVSVRIHNGEWRNNSALVGGAIMCDRIGTVRMAHVTFGSNTATQNGGAIAAGSSCTMIATSVIFDGNTAPRGGAVDLDGNSATFTTGSELTSNECTGLLNSLNDPTEALAALPQYGSYFTNNMASTAGGTIHCQNRGMVSIGSCSLFYLNGAGCSGGAVAASACSVRADRAYFLANAAAAGYESSDEDSQLQEAALALASQLDTRSCDTSSALPRIGGGAAYSGFSVSTAYAQQQQSYSQCVFIANVGSLGGAFHDGGIVDSSSCSQDISQCVSGATTLKTDPVFVSNTSAGLGSVEKWASDDALPTVVSGGPDLADGLLANPGLNIEAPVFDDNIAYTAGDALFWRHRQPQNMHTWDSEVAYEETASVPFAVRIRGVPDSIDSDAYWDAVEILLLDGWGRRAYPGSNTRVTLSLVDGGAAARTAFNLSVGDSYVEDASGFTVTVGNSWLVGATDAYFRSYSVATLSGIRLQSLPGTLQVGSLSVSPSSLGFTQKQFDVQITACEAGSQLNPGTQARSCSQCTPGRFSDSVNALSCSECNPGRFARSSGSTKCTQCPAGTHTAASGVAECVECSPGFAQPLTGQEQCNKCEGNGTYADTSASTSCKYCEAGSVPTGTRDACSACPAGRFAQQYQGALSETCGECDVGSVSPSTGAKECTLCPKTSYMDQRGGRQCIPCPGDSYTDEAGSASCIPCPSTGVTCSGGVITYEQGFWRPHWEANATIDASSRLFECYTDAACIWETVTALIDSSGEVVEASEQRRLSAAPYIDDTAAPWLHGGRSLQESGNYTAVNISTGRVLCAEGHNGPICGTCEANYVMVDDSCVFCADKNSAVAFTVIGAIVVIVIASVIVWRGTTGRSAVSIVFRVLVNHLQMLALVSSASSLPAFPWCHSLPHAIALHADL